MKIKLFLSLLSFQFLSSCFFSKEQNLPLSEDFYSLNRTINSTTEIIQKEKNHIWVTTPKKNLLETETTLKWYNELKEIKILETKGSKDLSKTKRIGSFNFQSKKENLFIELFTASSFSFIKLRVKNLEENKLSYLAGEISKEDTLKLTIDFKLLQAKKILLPSNYQKIFYINGNKEKYLSKEKAEIVFQCFHTFKSDKTIYHGPITPEVAYQYSVGKKINANIPGLFRIIDENQKAFDIRLGKSEESGARVRIWVQGSHKIEEASLPCLGKVRPLLTDPL